MSIYDYEQEIEEILDKALNNLSPEDYEMLLDDIDKLVSWHSQLNGNLQGLEPIRILERCSC